MENNVDVDPAVLHVLESASHPFVSYDSAGSALVAAFQSAVSVAQPHLEPLAAAFFFRLKDDGSFDGSFMGPRRTLGLGMSLRCRRTPGVCG